MNYIKRLERQVRLMADEIVRRENQRQDLIAHLHSSKFREHRYIAVEDVLVRLGAGFGTTGSHEGTDDQVAECVEDFTFQASTEGVQL